MRILSLLLLMLLSLPLPARAEPLKVLVSIPPAAWFVRQVAGDAAEIEVMVPPGASPHVYEPKPGQMAKVSKADLYMAVGVEFEKVWLPRFTGVNPGLEVVHLDVGIHKLPMAEHHHEGEEHERMDADHEEHGHDADHGETMEKHHDQDRDHHGEMAEHHDHEAMPADADHHEAMQEHHHDGEHRESEAEEHGHEAEHHHDHDGLDPHVWLSPRLALTLVDNAERALAHARPAQAEAFAANADRTRAAIEALEHELVPLFAELPSRRFVVFHPSWGYFAHAFDLVQMPIETEGREPSPRELHDLLAEAREHNVRAVFVQPQMSRRTASIVAGELSGRVVVADPLAADWDVNLTRVAHEMAAAMKEGR